MEKSSTITVTEGQEKRAFIYRDEVCYVILCHYAPLSCQLIIFCSSGSFWSPVLTAACREGKGRAMTSCSPTSLPSWIRSLRSSLWVMKRNTAASTTNRSLDSSSTAASFWLTWRTTSLWVTSLHLWTRSAAVMHLEVVQWLISEAGLQCIHWFLKKEHHPTSKHGRLTVHCEDDATFLSTRLFGFFFAIVRQYSKTEISVGNKLTIC